MKILQKILLKVYSLVNKTGLLETYYFKKTFWFAYFLYKQYVEDPFWGFTRKYPHLFQGGNILDIGANIGYTSTIFSNVISTGFKVYAFEPDETNFKSLKEIVKLRKKIGKIIPIQAAVGETKGTIKIWHNENHHADHRIVTEEYKRSGINPVNVSTVPCWSIDSFVDSELSNQAVKFIKIDVQGYELPVCLGMENTLLANPDLVIVLEYMPASMSELGFVPDALLNFFQDRDYFIYVLQQRGNLETANDGIIHSMLKKREYIDLVCSRRKLM